MPRSTTRREAIKTVAAGVALPAVGGGAAPLVQIATAYQPKTLSTGEFRLLTTLVDMIIPPSETPGAAAAGVDRYIDEELAEDENLRKTFDDGLKMLEQASFRDLDEAGRVKLLTEYSGSSGAKGRFFQKLKDLTIDGYYSTEIGLVEELGYKGNTFLQEFPGCQDEEHL